MVSEREIVVGAFSVIVQPVVEPMDRFAALLRSLARLRGAVNILLLPAAECQLGGDFV